MVPGLKTISGFCQEIKLISQMIYLYYLFFSEHQLICLRRINPKISEAFHSGKSFQYASQIFRITQILQKNPRWKIAFDFFHRVTLCPENDEKVVGKWRLWKSVCAYCGSGVTETRKFTTPGLPSFVHSREQQKTTMRRLVWRAESQIFGSLKGTLAKVFDISMLCHFYLITFPGWRPLCSH